MRILYRTRMVRTVHTIRVRLYHSRMVRTMRGIAIVYRAELHSSLSRSPGDKGWGQLEHFALAPAP